MVALESPLPLLRSLPPARPARLVGLEAVLSMLDWDGLGGVILVLVLVLVLMLALVLVLMHNVLRARRTSWDGVTGRTAVAIYRSLTHSLNRTNAYCWLHGTSDDAVVDGWKSRRCPFSSKRCENALDDAVGV